MQKPTRISVKKTISEKKKIVLPIKWSMDNLLFKLCIMKRIASMPFYFISLFIVAKGLWIIYLFFGQCECDSFMYANLHALICKVKRKEKTCKHGFEHLWVHDMCLLLYHNTKL